MLALCGHNFGREDQRGTHVCFSNAVVLTDILDAGASAQVAYHDLNKYARSGDNWSTGDHCRIDADV